MPTDYPGGLDDFANPTGSESMSGQDGFVLHPEKKHSKQHTDINDAVEAIQAYVGVEGSTDPGTLTGLVNLSGVAGPSGPASGVLAGTYPNPSFAVDPFARVNHTGSQLAVTISDLTESVQDIIGATLLDSPSIDFTYTDPSNQIIGAVLNSPLLESQNGAFYLARANHTGTQSADTLTDGTTNKAFLATERTKLTGIATGATANSLDSFLLDRVNHTGVQAESTITNLVSDLAGKQPLDATLTALAAADWVLNSIPIGTGANTLSQLSFAANTFPARSSSGNVVAKTITDFGLSLIDDADAAAAKTTLGLVIGTNVQAFDQTLTALAAADWATNALPIGSGANTLSQVTFAANTFPGRSSSGNLVAKTITDYGLSLVDDADATTARTTLGLGTAAIVDTGTGAANVPTITQADARYVALAGSTSTGQQIVPTFKATGGTGANTSAVTFTGANASGAPTTGAHVKDELAGDSTGKLWYCTVAGTPGTWVQISGAGGGGSVAADTIWDAAGDLAVGTGADTAAKLSKGTSLQYLRVNSGGTALEWATLAAGGTALGTSFNPAGTTFASTDVQNVIQEIDTDIDARIALGIIDARSGMALLTQALPTGGTTNQALTKVSGSNYDVTWSTVSGSGIPASTIDAKGDLLAGTANDTVSRLAVGADGKVLTADSSQATGLAWTTVSGSGVTDGDKGDITVSSSGATYTVDNDVVTYAKMQNIATDSLIGRDTASTGDPETISVGGGIEFTGSGGIQRSALTGDVAASAGSGSTTIQTNAVTTSKITDANVTYAKIQNVSATSRILGRKTAGAGVIEELTASDVNTILGTSVTTYTVYDVSDQSARTNNTLTDDTVLILSSLPTGTYILNGFIRYDSDNTADFKIGWSSTGTMTLDWASNGTINTANGSAGQIERGSLAIGTGGTVGANTAGNVNIALPSGVLIITVSGNLTLQWAQATTTGGTNTIRKGKSWIRLEKIA